MFRYRFVTPHRRGKWYPDLETAQRFAVQIGAGFMEMRSGKFFPYRDTRLEVKQADAGPGTLAQSADNQRRFARSS